MRFLTATLAIVLACSTQLKAKGNSPSQHLLFIENKGQVKDQYHNQRTDIDFKISSGALNVFVGNGELHYQFHQPAPAGIEKGITKHSEPISMYRMDVLLLNANKNARIVTEGELPYYEQHYKATTPVTAHSFSKIIYKDIYPSIDWVLYIKDNQLEYDFVVHNGGHPADIKLQYNGATSLTINDNGSLTATTPMGNITEAAPYSYQEDGKPVASSFALNNNTLSFKTASYQGELTIDPAVVWATYYAGENGAEIYSTANDNAGGIYIAGGTTSTNDIATIGSHQSTMIASQGMAFLAKFNSAGVRQWGTYFGGVTSEFARDISVDGLGNIYMVGDAYSAGIATSGAHQETPGSSLDGFLAKFNSAGVLQWATYFGGDTTDIIKGVANDNSGNVFIGGYTQSVNNIATAGSFQPVMTAMSDAFLAKFDTDGTLLWSTFYGDMLSSQIDDICTDEAGNIYFAGTTSDIANIATPGSHQETIGSLGDNFLVKFNTNGERVWGTYYGGNQTEQPCSIASDNFGHIYIGSTTMSNDNIATPGSHQPSLSPVSHDVYLAQFDTDGVRQWGTYYGHWGNDGIGAHSGNNGITTDDSGNVYIAGITTSDSSIATPCTHQQNRAGFWDNYIVKFNSAGARQWGTYFGGTSGEGAISCTYYSGSLYLGGNTGSNSGIATPGSHDDTYSGNPGGDGFLLRFTDCEIPQQPTGISGLTTLCEGDTVVYSTGAVCQATSYTWSLPPGWTGTSNVDSIIAIAGANSGNVTVAGNSACGTGSAQTLAVTVNPAPLPIIAIAGNLLSTGSYTAYQWNLNGIPITGATAQTYEYTQPGEYTVTVTDANGCTATSAPFSTSVDNVSGNHAIALYPNPNPGNFTLAITGLNGNENVSIEITDITGRRIQTFTESAINRSIQKNITLDKLLPAGQYFLKLSSGVLNKVLMFTKY